MDKLTLTPQDLLIELARTHPAVNQHSIRVALYCIALASATDMQPQQRRSLNEAATLHDVGKIAVPETILSKPGRLTTEEWDVVRAHTVVGERLAASVGVPPELRAVLRHHHERWDGSGYPDGLIAFRIPVLARFVAVADAFDAMVSARPYRDALPVKEAMKELRRVSGIQLDPALVDRFVKIPAEVIDRVRLRSDESRVRSPQPALKVV